MTPEFRLVDIAMAAGMAIFLLIPGSVFASGQTFGQRCAVMYQVNSQDWQDCVSEFVGVGK